MKFYFSIQIIIKYFKIEYDILKNIYMQYSGKIMICYRMIPVQTGFRWNDVF